MDRYSSEWVSAYKRTAACPYERQSYCVERLPLVPIWERQPSVTECGLRNAEFRYGFGKVSLASDGHKRQDCRNAATNFDPAESLSARFTRMPMRRMRSCARAASGNPDVAAPPRTPRNSRRRMLASRLAKHHIGSNEYLGTNYSGCAAGGEPDKLRSYGSASRRMASLPAHRSCARPCG